MKKSLLLIVITLLSPFAVFAQDASMAINSKNNGILWPCVEFALAENGIAPTAFNQQAGTMLTDFVQFNVLLIPNRAKYSFKFQNNKLDIELTNKEYQSQTGWVSNPIPLGKKVIDKQVGELAKRIEVILASSELSNKAVQNSKLFPVFKSSETINNLTMQIVSTRCIGDKTMISGFFSSNTTQNITSMNELTLISPTGAKYSTNHGAFAGKETYYLGQIAQTMEPDIPVSFDVLFDTKGEKMDLIKKFSVKMYRPDNTQFNFYDIALPMQKNPLLDESTVEVYKDVYLTFRKQEKTEGSLKIHFIVENKSLTARQISIEQASIIDSNGMKHDRAKVLIGNEDLNYRVVTAEPEIPMAGLFEFEGNIPFDAIRLLRFSTRQYANFAIRKIVCKE